MSIDRYRRRVNALAIIASSAFAGTTFFIGLSMGTYWLGLDPLEFVDAFAPQFQSFLLTIMPLFLLTLMGLILSARLDWQDSDIKRSWQIAIGCYAATSLITLAIHMPENLNLLSAEYSEIEAADARRYWLTWHVPRVIIAFGIPLFAVRAVYQRTSKVASDTTQRHERLNRLAQERT